MIRLLFLALLLLPFPAWADTFTPVTTYDCSTASGNLPADVPATWTYVTGETGVIDSNSTTAGKCTASIVGADSALFNTGTFDNNQYAQAVITVTSTSAGTGPCLIVRAQAAADTYYRACFSHAASSNVTCSKVVAGSFSACSVDWPTTQGFTDGQTFRFAATGTTTTTLRVYLDTVEIGIAAVDSSSPINNGKPGIGHSTDTTANTFDSLEFGNVTVGGGATLFRNQGDLTGLGTGGKFKKDPSQ